MYFVYYLLHINSQLFIYISVLIIYCTSLRNMTIKYSKYSKYCLIMFLDFIKKYEFKNYYFKNYYFFNNYINTYFNDIQSYNRSKFTW